MNIKQFNIVKDEIENQATIKDINDGLFNTMLYLTCDIKLDFINLDNRDLWINEHQEKIIDFVSVNNLIEKEKNKYIDEYDFYEDLNEFSYEISKALFYLNEDKEELFIIENIENDTFEYETFYIKHGHMQSIYSLDDFDEAYEYMCGDEVFTRRFEEFTIEINDNSYCIEKEHKAFELLEERFWG